VKAAPHGDLAAMHFASYVLPVGAGRQRQLCRQCMGGRAAKGKRNAWASLTQAG